jgi:prolyl oligopeptidase
MLRKCLKNTIFMVMKRLLVFSLMAAIVFDACAPKKVVTRKDSTVDNYFGTEVPDPYRWLEDDASEETAAWVKAQNKGTDYYLKLLPGRAKLLERLKEVANYEEVGTPWR